MDPNMYRCGTICEILKMTMIVVLVTSCRRISSQVRKYYMHLTKTRTKSVSTETSRDSIVNQNTKCESNRMNGPFLLVLIAWRLSFNCRRWPTPSVGAFRDCWSWTRLLWKYHGYRELCTLSWEWPQHPSVAKATADTSPGGEVCHHVRCLWSGDDIERSSSPKLLEGMPRVFDAAMACSVSLLDGHMLRYATWTMQDTFYLSS